ncbi:hypothetical protein VP01_545g6 [Puccinia sorghi]|uniref:Retrovirus-related Pol polyprotein from transposon TNT 1-94-like beta-barrel domain-containing protein n=1 Tax=Puccinia sorghi TaxID=27349 RepID=A0A0L6UKA9_9BASI|nr:hypothetical protein VP01_545g6 [Puccinia sorghi]
MSSEQAIQYSIPSLSNTTFSNWKTQVLAYCMEYNLDKFLLRDLTPPPAREAKKLEVKLWMLLTNYYKSKAANDEAKVYQTFCNFKFTKDLSSFFNDLNAHLASMTSVGLKVGIPDKIHIPEHLLADQIIQKLPESPLTSKTHYSPKSLLLLMLSKNIFRPESQTCWQSTFTSQPWSKPNLPLLPPKCTVQTEHTIRPPIIPKASVGNSILNRKSHLESLQKTSQSCCYCISKHQSYSAHAKMTMFLDLGCSDHMFPKKEFFSNYKPISSAIEITDGKSLKFKGSGYVHLNDGVVFLNVKG